MGVIPAALIFSSAARHSSHVVGRRVRVEPRLLDQVEVDDDRIDELVEREVPCVALPQGLLRRWGSPRGPPAQDSSFGTVQPFQAELERPGPAPVVPEVRAGLRLARRLLGLDPCVRLVHRRLDRHVRVLGLECRDHVVHPGLDARRLEVSEPPELDRHVAGRGHVELASRARSRRRRLGRLGLLRGRLRLAVSRRGGASSPPPPPPAAAAGRHGEQRDERRSPSHTQCKSRFRSLHLPPPPRSS